MFTFLGTTLACLSFLPAFWIPESPRWLALNNKHEEAFKVLSDMAKKNGKILTMTEMDEIRAILLQINMDSQMSNSSSVNLSPLDLFRSGHAARSSILCFGWMTACIGFYALTLNSTQLNGHIVINFALLGITEFPVPVIVVRNICISNAGRFNFLPFFKRKYVDFKMQCPVFFKIKKFRNKSKPAFDLLLHHAYLVAYCQPNRSKTNCSFGSFDSWYLLCSLGLYF